MIEYKTSINSLEGLYEHVSEGARVTISKAIEKGLEKALERFLEDFYKEELPSLSDIDNLLDYEEDYVFERLQEYATTDGE